MKNQELIGTYLSTEQVFDNGPDRRCIIGTVRLPNGDPATVKGYASEDQISESLTYRFYGNWRTHHKFGRQFNFGSFVEEMPADEDSLIAYLMQCRKPERGSVTRRVAEALFNLYGHEVIECLMRDPVAASEKIPRWDAAKAGAAADWLKANHGTQQCKLSLIKLFDGRGFPKRTMDRAIKEWGAKAADVIREDPYELTSLPGIGFKGADKLYCDLARETSATDEEYQEKLADIKRQGLCAAYCVASESSRSGSTWIPEGMVKAFVTQNIGRVRATPEAAITWARMNGKIADRDGFIATARNSLHELEIAEFVMGAAGHNLWPSIDEIAAMAPDGKPLSDHQLDAIRIATSGSIGCLQGSPGVGKTFGVACIVKAMIHKYGKDKIAVAAPTGKAGVRVSQSMLANGVDLPASTIHRLLQVESEGGSDGWSFHYHDQNPLPFAFIICDESSMIDTNLMASLVRACTPMTHILLIGDSNQLAPVGHGRPFLDLQSCVPTGHLTEIRRNSGQIVASCALIRDERRIEFSPSLNLPEHNLVLIEADGDDQVIALQNIIGKIEAESDCNIVRDVQIVTAKNDGSCVARKPLNAMLQKMLNPDGDQVRGNPFRIDDKIVCLKNGKYPDSESSEEEHFIANGELSFVRNIQPGRMWLALEDPDRNALVAHAPVQESESGISDSEDAQRGAVGDWDLGYCLSVHRSQGSQWKYCIVMADRSGAMIQTRNWIYTAISRAEIATFVIGTRAVVNQMMRRDGISQRKTFLVERICQHREASAVDVDSIFASV